MEDLEAILLPEQPQEKKYNIQNLEADVRDLVEMQRMMLETLQAQTARLDVISENVTDSVSNTNEAIRQVKQCSNIQGNAFKGILTFGIVASAPLTFVLGVKVGLITSATGVLFGYLKYG